MKFVEIYWKILRRKYSRMRFHQVIQLNSSTFTFIDVLGSIFDPLNDNHPTAMLQKYIT